MSLEQTTENPVHFPEVPTKFMFDAEVVAIFENMAHRSIPNFREAHITHARMLEQWFQYPGATVLDIGASRGSFLDAIKQTYRLKWRDNEINFTVVDNSEDMCKYLRTDYPQVNVECSDIASEAFLKDTRRFDVVCANYVLQFVPQNMQWLTLLHLFQMVRPGGVFIFGHKSQHSGVVGELAHEQYIQFRIRNGYRREEIAAKTKALAGSMFPMSHEAVLNATKQSFSEVMETFRFMMFSTFFAIK